jgi:hypothetical protein
MAAKWPKQYEEIKNKRPPKKDILVWVSDNVFVHQHRATTKETANWYKQESSKQSEGRRRSM